MQRMTYTQTFVMAVMFFCSVWTRTWNFHSLRASINRSSSQLLAPNEICHGRHPDLGAAWCRERPGVGLLVGHDVSRGTTDHRRAGHVLLRRIR